jgi:hypothetical protein
MPLWLFTSRICIVVSKGPFQHYILHHVPNGLEFVLLYTAHAHTRQIIEHKVKSGRGGTTWGQENEKAALTWLSQITYEENCFRTPTVSRLRGVRVFVPTNSPSTFRGSLAIGEHALYESPAKGPKTTPIKKLVIIDVRQKKKDTFELLAPLGMPEI